MEPPSEQSPDQTKRLSIRPEWKDNRLSLRASIKPSPNAIPALKSPTIEQSPLTQQTRPDVFEPKVVGLYRKLFRENEDDEKPDGFWRELFLLRPDIPRLRQILQDTDADFLLQTQHQPQQLVVHAIETLKVGQAPSDENALDVSLPLIATRRLTCTNHKLRLSQSSSP